MAKEKSDAKTNVLIKKHCASCHVLGIPRPSSIASLPAPPMNGVIFHLKKEIKSKKKQKEFIVNYSLNPKPEQSICDMIKVNKFGVMPSLKGKVSKKDLELIASKLLKDFPTKEFVESRAEAKLYKEIYKLRNSPFLINQSSLPHITLLLMQNWGKGKLGLTDEQKRKLLKIRSHVIENIKSIKERLSELEQDIIQLTMYDGEIEVIETKVKEAAKLKAKATMIQIQCIMESVEILTDKQMALLVPFWEL
jgi:cytochrome c